MVDFRGQFVDSVVVGNAVLVVRFVGVVSAVVVAVAVVGVGSPPDTSVGSGAVDGYLDVVGVVAVE